MIKPNNRVCLNGVCLSHMWGLVVSLLFCGLVQSSQAQEAAGLAAENKGAAKGGDDSAVPAEVEEIVITGSRIKRSSAFPSSAPVEVIDSKQIARSGARHLGDLLQNLTNAPGTGLQGWGAGGADGRAGTAAPNLRGLGIGATLVLINGRRFVTNPGGNAPQTFSDMGIVPIGAVRRVEILKGGASAVYGADAVAGVVNIITHQDYDGLKVFINADSSDSFSSADYVGYTVGATFGAHNDRASVMVSADYNFHTELLLNRRDWSEGAATVGPIGYPGNFLVNGQVMPDPNCVEAPNASIVNVNGAAMCGFDDRDFLPIIPALRRSNVLANGRYKLTDHTTAFIEANVSQMEGDQVARPFFLLPAFSLTVPADHVDNIYGETAYYGGRVAGQPHGRVAYDYKTYRIVTGLRGDFESAASFTMFEDWEWELFLTSGKSHVQVGFPENLMPDLQAALNSCSDPSDLSGCFNPFYSSVLGTGTANSADVLRQIQTRYKADRISSLRTYNASLSGTLFELPGGPLGIAFGGQVRFEDEQGTANHEATTNRLGTLTGEADYKVDRRVYAGFLELRLPILRGVELQGAGRVERHTDISETSANPTVGLTFSPSSTFGEDTVPDVFRRLTLRGHVAKAFRAPTMTQASNIVRILPQQILVPGGPSLNLPVESSGDPNLKSETSVAWSAGLDWSPFSVLSIEGEYWSYTYENRIDVEDANGKIQQWARSNEQLGDCNTMDPSITVDVAAGCTPTGVKVSAFNSPATITTSGLDFGLMLRLSGESFGGSERDWGLFTAGVQGTYTLSYKLPRASLTDAVVDGGYVKCDGTSDTSQCEVVGNRNATNVAPPLPKLRARLPFSWAYGGHVASVNVQFIGPVDDDKDPTAHIDSMTTVDLQYGYTIENWVGRSLTMRVGVTNLFDQDPPTVAADQYGYDPLLHDPRGRMLYAKLSSEL